MGWRLSWRYWSSSLMIRIGRLLIWRLNCLNWSVAFSARHMRRMLVNCYTTQSKHQYPHKLTSRIEKCTIMVQTLHSNRLKQNYLMPQRKLCHCKEELCTCRKLLCPYIYRLLKLLIIQQKRYKHSWRNSESCERKCNKSCVCINRQWIISYRI